MVLAAAQGRSDLAIASALQVNRHSVKLWRKRFAEQGFAECVGDRAGTRS